MKKYSLQYSKEASKDLLKLDRSIALRVVKKILVYAESEQPLLYAKQLKGFAGVYRYRIGDYRAIFEVSENGIITLLTILHIAHRKDIYRDTI